MCAARVMTACCSASTVLCASALCASVCSVGCVCASVCLPVLSVSCAEPLLLSVPVTGCVGCVPSVSCSALLLSAPLTECVCLGVCLGGCSGALIPARCSRCKQTGTCPKRAASSKQVSVLPSSSPPHAPERDECDESQTLDIST